ncbi:calcineurin-like phosphoesterase C-terminal domain-containing protein [Luteimonas sp. SJ-92]|uniref:Calcineurin-like phosphoesterase C-terminal domain-containing protein n=1 Tax=Luteimonas salinisoli TaxID=2752307 RepID=A0A853JCS7_9GAMM|nr:calcineurin-like phosphoesterase family protein [Luteimonas salinisoli]NZA26645.1 calcineurin-like phosphoesterase C-terminal domain-containing protein [Luteimonas salinisoli]
MRETLRIMLALALGATAGQAFGCTAGSVVERRPHGEAASGAEDGLAGVKVSDGRQLAVSDAQGRWRLPAPAQGPVFMIKPPGHAVPAGADGLPDFWRPVDAADCDFALVPAEDAAGAPLEVLVFADPQAGNAREAEYYGADVVAPLQDGHRARLGVGLGDIANDDLSLYPAINAWTTRLGVPWLHVAGNHDLDAGVADDADSLRTFRRVYGPDTFAWEEPEAVFIGLDDVIALPGQRPAYIGGLRGDQFDFLEAYLASLPRERLLVLMLHIPLFDTSADAATFRPADRQRLFRLLERFPHVLVLSGHRHVLQHRFHGVAEGWRGERPLHEFNVGAVSGAFWSGVADAMGIPDATMADGTPNGHALLRIGEGGDYALDWVPARVPADDPAFTAAMRLHAPRTLRRGAYPAWGVYANVFMGLDDTRVEFRIGDGEWRPMRRVSAPDPWLATENARDDLAAQPRGFDRSPEAVPSTHLWRGALPTALDPGEHRIEVRAFDRWNGERRAATSYRLVDLGDEP